MQSQTQRIFETPQEIRETRRQQVAKAVSECTSTLPNHISQLDSLLSAPAVDLARVTRIISCDSDFTGLLLSLASTGLFNARSCGVTISQAVVLFGSERLRALALACACMKYAGRGLSHAERHQLWQHSFLTAALSERTARQVGYPESGQAYLAGLLHDIGRLPLLFVARQGKSAGSVLPVDWQDSLSAERNCFGADHCEVGRAIAAAWNLSPNLIDAIEHHHSPSCAEHDTGLAEVVAAGDRYADLLSPVVVEAVGDAPTRKADAMDALLRICVPNLPADDATGLTNLSQDEQFDEDLMARPLN